MLEYTLEYAKEIAIEFVEISPAQHLTRYQPGYDQEIEIQNIKINGNDISEWLQSDLLKRHEAEWIKEMLERRL